MDTITCSLFAWVLTSRLPDSPPCFPLGPDAFQTDYLVFDYCMACDLFSLLLGLARPWALRLVASYFSLINKNCIEHGGWISAPESGLHWVMSCLASSSSAVWLCYLPPKCTSPPRGRLFSSSAPERALRTGTPRLLCLQPLRSSKVLHEIELTQCLASCLGWGRRKSGRQLLVPLRGILNIWLNQYLACPEPRARLSSKHSSVTYWETWSINSSLWTWMTSQWRELDPAVVRAVSDWPLPGSRKVLQFFPVGSPWWRWTHQRWVSEQFSLKNPLTIISCIRGLIIHTS